MRRVTLLLLCALLASACASAASTDAVRDDRVPTTEALALGTGGDAEEVRVEDDPTEAGGILIGFALSPRSYTEADFPAFLDRIEGNAEVLMHAGDWMDLEDPVSAYHLVATLAEERDMASLVVISPSGGGDLLRPLDADTRTRYLDLLTAYLIEHQPDYLGLANEVNMLAQQDPDGFEAVVGLWREAVRVVRRESPDTKAFVTFQYERTIGRHDGWFGGEVVEPDWSIIDRFPGMDVLAFTSYPSLVLDDPAELGDDYYAQIGDRTDLPVVFTELGWTSDPGLPVLPGSEEEQVAFLDVFDTQVEAVGLEAAVWTFVHGDLVLQEPFGSMDLFRPDDTPRPAWARWLQLDR